MSKHFSKSEFACHCCGELIIVPGLIDALERLRALVGKPIKIHDGYRCPTHNEQAGGVADSEHTRGVAADIEIVGLSLQQMYDLALQIPAFFRGGIGVYDGGFLHVDVRQHAARWARLRGQYVSIDHLVQVPVPLLAKMHSAAQGQNRG